MSDKPAFPHALAFQDGGFEISPGMTLRDYFAAKAMAVWLADGLRLSGLTSEDDIIISELAYSMADAMLAERVKREECRVVPDEEGGL